MLLVGKGKGNGIDVVTSKKLVIIVGDPVRVRSMIDNNRADGRYTGLKWRLIALDADPFGRRI